MAVDLTSAEAIAQQAEQDRKRSEYANSAVEAGVGGYTQVYSGGQWYSLPADLYRRAAQGDVNARLEVSTMTGAMMYRGGPQGSVEEQMRAEQRRRDPIGITSVVVRSPTGEIRSSAVKSAVGPGYAYATYDTPESQRTAQSDIQAKEHAYQLAKTAAQEAEFRANYYGLYGEGLPEAKTAGDKRTEELARQLEFMTKYGSGVQLSREASTMMALEVLRGSKYRSGDIRSAQYYSGELQKVASRPIERASEYHYLGMASGIAVPANPWEYQGDLAVEFLKGYSNADERDWFSPVSGEMEQFTPGMGLQEWSWQVGLNTDKPEKYERAPDVSFMPAIQHLAETEGEYGPYGYLFGGPDYIGTPSSEGIRKQADFVFTPEAQRNVKIALEVSRAEREESGIMFPDATMPKYDEPVFAFDVVKPQEQKPEYNAAGVPWWADYPQNRDVLPVTEKRIKGTKTVASVGTLTDLPQTTPVEQKSAEVLRPSDFDLWATSVFGGGPVAEGLIRVSDFWFGGRTKIKTEIGEEVKGIPTTEYFEPITIQREVPGGIEYVTTTQSKTTTDSSTPITIAQAPVKSGFGSILDNLEDAIRFRIPSASEGEKALAIGSIGNPFIGPVVIGGTGVAVASELVFGKDSAISVKTKENVEIMYSMAPASPKGQYEYFYEHPTASAVNFALGIGIGGAAGVLEKGYMAGRAAMAEKIISGGKSARTLEYIGGAVMGRSPQILGGLYAADIAGRSTEGFTKVSPKSGEIARAIVMQEAVPMGIGFGVPASAAKAIRVSDIGYKQAKLEGDTTGRYDYYVRQTASNVARPARNDYLAYIQEHPVQDAGGIIDYVGYKAERFSEMRVKQPIRAFEQELPGKVQSATETLYGAYFNAKLKAPAAIEAAATRRVVPEVTNRWEAGGGLPENIPYPGARYYTSQDVKNAAINKYNKVVADALYTPSKPIAPEYNRPFVEPENEYALHYLSNYPEYPSLSRWVSPSTFGETKILPQLVTTTRAERGGGTSGKPDDGGTSGGFRKTVYGTGLVKEPSLASLRKSGAITPDATKTTARPGTLGKVTDYRGKAPERMKPFDLPKTKQGAIQTGLERPTAVESRAFPQTTTQTILVGFPKTKLKQKTETIQVIEPAVEFGQESEYRQETFGIAPYSALSMKTSRGVSEVSEKKRRWDDTIPISVVGLSLAPKVTTGTTTKTSQITGTEIDQGFKQMQRTEQITEQVPKFEQIITELPPPVVIPPGAPWFPTIAGGSISSGYRKGSRSYTEILGFEHSKRTNPFTKGKKKKAGKWGRI